MTGSVEIANGCFRIIGEEIVIPVKIGTILLVKENDIIKANSPVAEFDPFNDLVVSELEGTVAWVDLEVGKNVRRDEDVKTSNVIYKVIEQKREKLNPRMVVSGENGSEEYAVPVDALINIVSEDKVKIGDILFKIPSIAEKNRDITGG